MRKILHAAIGLLMALMPLSLHAADFGKTVTWDRYSLIVDGRRVCPVMGEIHYSRLPANEWAREVRKMKEGGVTMIATYVFWNHIEEQEGIYRWDGQRDLRRFLEVCKHQEMPVVLRIGPFCHGEVRNGGLPDWIWNPSPSGFEDGVDGKPLKLRSTDPRFLGYVEKLYRQIFAQVQGLQWKDGGPLIACQFDNEYRGSGDYLMALKKMALRIGFDLPFYTRTGWPELSKPVPFGEMLPLYGDYADGFWDKSTGETPGNYYKAFNFKGSPLPASPLGEESAVAGLSPESNMTDYSQISNLQSQFSILNSQFSNQTYPYFTCELGGGMATAYHRRPYIYAEDTYSLALVKLGSGSNLLGYYMYHGGTNPESSTGITLNETQRTPGTANNDLPVKNYDFQAPLGEFGQANPQYYALRPLHLFLQDFGEQLAVMEASFPAPQDLRKGDDSVLRWAVRSRQDAAFVFVNNYERLQNLTAKKHAELSACGVAFPRMTIPAGCMAIFPVNIDGIRYATAQIVARRNGKLFLMQIEGIPTTIALQDGKVLKNLKPQGKEKPVYGNICLLTRQEAEYLFLSENIKHQPSNFKLPLDLWSLATEGTQETSTLLAEKLREPGPLRPITKGPAKVAEAPSELDWDNAAIYTIHLPDIVVRESYETTDGTAGAAGADRASALLSIDYRGDCARLYAGGRLIADHFQYGRPFLYGLRRLPEGCNELELRILPLQEGAPIYLPREADKTPGEGIKEIKITNY